ncbi:hypothetical protein BDN72DRAFT_958128 [Pluteus cervinus]|uniref:Uncharacterized protein n=1 Tax=Pluteus cervinus TaxID=181527 RepID=A0ACD3AZS2_9AGAR|nr:hypothetical protein BDN72DRAFT_958128 [Pluteus cervinus]
MASVKESQVLGAQFDHRVKCLLESTLTTEALVSAARSIISSLESVEHFDVFDILGVSSVRLHGVLRAMLDHANDCGGPEALRYSSSTISACGLDEHLHEIGLTSTLEALRELAITWITHFLFFFKAPQPYTAGAERENMLHTGSVTQKQVLRRDAVRNPVNGLKGEECTVILDGDLDLTFYMFAVHILPPTIGKLPRESPNSIVSPFNMLRSYCGLPDSALESINCHLEHPSNYITLDWGCQWAFELFHWSLIRTEEPNSYKIKVFNPEHRYRLSLYDNVIETKVITFKDYGNEDVSLPDPTYFRIHAAIAGVVHDSGVAKFLDDLLQKCSFFVDEDPLPLPESFDDILRDVRIQLMKESFYQAKDLEE